MNTLAPTQHEFQNYLLDGGDTIVARVVDAGALDAHARLAIYAEAYRLRLLEALETDFVALRALLGNEAFTQLGRAYIAAHPSRHPSLRHFGRQLAEFLGAASPWKDQPWLAELAAFEWALTDAFDAADDPILDIDAIAAIAPTDWPRLRFEPHASLVRLDLRWNASVLWKAADQGLDMPPPVASDIATPWVIWRRDLQSYFRSLDASEAGTLDALRTGANFAALCEVLCEWIDANEVPTHAAGLLKRWGTDGMLRALRLD